MNNKQTAAVGFAGLVLLSFGMFMVWTPLGLVTPGVALVAFGLLVRASP